MKGRKARLGSLLTGIDGDHVDVRLNVILGRGSRHHIQCGLGGVGMRMSIGFVRSREASFHRGDVDDEFLALRIGMSSSHEYFQLAVQDEQCQSVYRQDVADLCCGHIGQLKHPGVRRAEIDRLLMNIECRGNERGEIGRASCRERV